MKNIVLIGMPSSGKTSIGKEISIISGREFIDTDEIVEERSGKTIPEIFEEQGEKGFRVLEREAVREASEKSDAVIACGGGAVLDEENIKNLKRNGIIVFIERETEQLSTEGRPLSSSRERIKEMEKERMPLYKKYADYTIKNDTTPVAAAETILRGIK